MANQFLYIDDSGTKEYAGPGESYGRGGGKSRYFVFGGVLLAETPARLTTDRIVTAKRFFFDTENVEIKSNWLRYPAERERRYLRPFNLSEEALKNFVDEYYEIVAEADLQLIVAVVDKQHLQEVYKGRDLWYAPAVAYEILMQRVVQEVRHPDRVAVYIDDMTGATPAGNQYKTNLKNHHKQLVQSGSRLLRGASLDFRSIRGEPRFLNSAHSHLIQVADIAAYNVYRQFLDHGEAWEEAVEGDLPTYEWFTKLEKKFRQGPDRRIQGYGVVKFPLLNRVPWRVTD